MLYQNDNHELPYRKHEKNNTIFITFCVRQIYIEKTYVKYWSKYYSRSIIQNPPLPPSSVVIQNIPSQQQSSQTSTNIHRSSSHIHHRQSAQSSHVKSISSNCIISSASVLYDNKSNCNQDKDNPSLAFSSSSSSSTGKENTQEDNDEPDKSAVVSTEKSISILKIFWF